MLLSDSFLLFCLLFAIITGYLSIMAIIEFMREYELAITITPAFDVPKTKALITKISDLVKAEKGKVKSNSSWPKRALAYKINKEKEAQFIFINFEADTLKPDFQKKVKLVDGVMRFLLLKK